MYAEFSQVSVFTMSNSEIFLVKEEEEGIEFDILKRPALEFQEESQETPTSSSHDTPADQEREVMEDHGGEETNDVTAASKESEKKKKKNICLGEFKAKDDDDGFKTPTSLDHKIPVIKQCPPAPRKPKPLPSNKRKASSSSTRTRRNLQLDLSQEVESLFPRPLLADLHRKIKKARTEENK